MGIMGIIFSNILDDNMRPLTDNRTSGSIPFGGRYRQIDFALSNMANSGIRNIGVVTKYNYQSLMDHLGNCEEWDLKVGDGVRFMPPYATGHTGAYRGKLEALQTALPVLERSEEEYVVLSDTTVLCAINYRLVVEEHIQSGCDITVVAKAGVCNGEKKQQLAFKLDENGKVADLAVDYAAPEDYLAGMSMFICRRESLMSYIKENTARGRFHLERDFLLPEFNAGNLSINVYRFHNVALFNESIPEYYRNNMLLLREDVRHSLFRSEVPIYTKVRDAVPTLIGENGHAPNCVLADGCRIFGTAEDCILFREVHIEEKAEVRNCIVMQACSIGAGAKLSYVILDKNATVSPGAVVCGTPDNPVVIRKGAIV